MKQAGVCPECEFEFTATDLTAGETLACPECALTLQVRALNGHELEFDMIESELPDWGQ